MKLHIFVAIRTAVTRVSCVAGADGILHFSLLSDSLQDFTEEVQLQGRAARFLLLPACRILWRSFSCRGRQLDFYILTYTIGAWVDAHAC